MRLRSAVTGWEEPSGILFIRIYPLGASPDYLNRVTRSRGPRCDYIAMDKVEAFEISSEVDHTAKRVDVVWRGVFDLRAIGENCQERIRKGGHRYLQFIDATGAEVARSYDDSRKVGEVTQRLAAQSLKFGIAGPTAILVNTKIDYGMCRVVASYFEPAGNIAVFYNRAEAQTWLGANQPG